jgi:hypothetical protein
MTWIKLSHDMNYGQGWCENSNECLGPSQCGGRGGIFSRSLQTDRSQDRLHGVPKHHPINNNGVVATQLNPL